MKYTYEEMAKMIDHSLLHPTMTDADLEAGCALAARYQVASTSSQGIANNGSATLEGVTITNHSGASCTLTVTKYPVPPGGAPASSGEMPVYWQISTDCTTYNFDLVFNYTDTEVLFGNGVTESALQAYRSTNGNDFSLVGGTVNTSANTVTVTGVTQLS